MVVPRSTALEIFGLKENFSESELKSAYRRLVKIVHPDAGGDAELFKFIEACKNLLVNGESTSQNATETNNQKSNSHQANTRPKKETVGVTLGLLDQEYPNNIGEYEQKYDIQTIRASLLVYIRPKYRKNMEKCITVKATIPYSELNKELNFVKFTQTIRIPEEMHKFRKFKVRIDFLNETFTFKVSSGDIKVIKHAKYNYMTCLKSICELHFIK